MLGQGNVVRTLITTCYETLGLLSFSTVGCSFCLDNMGMPSLTFHLFHRHITRTNGEMLKHLNKYIQTSVNKCTLKDLRGESISRGSKRSRQALPTHPHCQHTHFRGRKLN